MNFIKNSVKAVTNASNTIGNAVEINLLKVSISGIEDDIKHNKVKFSEHDALRETIKLLEENVISNENSMNNLILFFINGNIDYKLNKIEFDSCYESESESDKYLIKLRDTYSDLLASRDSLRLSIDEVNSSILIINPQMHLVKVQELEYELEIEKEKLNVVRGKQFGKKK